MTKNDYSTIFTNTQKEFQLHLCELENHALHTKGIDSIRGIATKALISKIQRKFKLEKCIYDNAEQSYQFKLDTAFIKIYTLLSPKNENALALAREQKKAYDSFGYIEIFGLHQYNQNATIKEHSKALKELVTLLLTQSNSKTSFYLESYDIAFDYLDLKPYQVEAQLLDKLNQADKTLKRYADYKGCENGNFYIQNNDKSNIAPYTLKICGYDKNLKESDCNQKTINKPILRIEATFNTIERYYKDKEWISHSLKRIERAIKQAINTQDKEKIDKFKSAYPTLFEEVSNKPYNPIDELF